VSRADGSTPAAYPASARNLIRSQKTVKSKINDVKNKRCNIGEERFVSVCGEEVEYLVEAEQARQVMEITLAADLST
jgi:hypothetical protein